MYAVEVNHWWFPGKRMLFRQLLSRRLSLACIAVRR
jgi:hypothetical protein